MLAHSPLRFSAPRQAAALPRPVAIPAALRGLAAYAETACWAALFLLLAPIIGPRDCGLFVIAAGLIAILDKAVCGVVTQALMRAATLSSLHIATAFMTAIGLAGLASLAARGLLGGVPASADQAIVADMVQSLALLPLLGALIAVPEGLLRRQAADAQLAAMRLAGLVVAGSLTFVLASSGAGAWSLVLLVVMQRFVVIVLLWGVAGRDIGFSWSWRAAAELAAGLDWHTVCAVLGGCARFAPGLLIGLSLGPAAAGLYLVIAGIPEFTTAVWPGRVAAERPNAAIASLTGTRVTGTRVTGTRVAVALVAIPLLPILGPALLDLRWWGAIFPAQIMMAGLVAAAFGAACDQALRRGGGRAVSPRAEALAPIARLVAIAIAVPYGLTAVAAVVVLNATLAAAVSAWRLRRMIPEACEPVFGGLAAALAKAALVGMAIALAADPVGSALPPFTAAALLLALAAASHIVLNAAERLIASRPAIRSDHIQLAQLFPAVDPVIAERGQVEA